MELHAGDHFDRYVIESVIGRGGMGVVYLARDDRLDRRVALKLLAPELANDEGFRARFDTEARIAASLEEPHVVPIYEAGERDGQLFLAMRYVAGFDLFTLLKRHGPLPAHRAVAILEQLASAVDAAHAAGLVHRDIKPANILVASATSGGDHVYLVDFGLARTVIPGGPTRTGQFLGSLEYAAPEQIQSGPISAQTDIYALGEVLFSCLTARPPFEADADAGLMYAHLYTPPRAPSALNPEVPVAMDAVVAKAMAVSPEGRYGAASELAAAARDALATTVSMTVPAGRPPEMATSVGSGRARKTVTVMSVGLVADTAASSADPEAILARLARGEAHVRSVVARHGGTVDTVIGESASAIFGVPQLHEDDALRAVRAAHELIGGAGGIGIATGEVLAGESASRSLVTGEPVNVAARLEHSATAGEILLADSTYRLVRDEVEAQTRAVSGLGPEATAMVFVALRETETRPSTTTPLVGRDAQLGQLRDRWQGVVAERSPHLVTIVGPAGMGKSRLAFALADAIDGRLVSGRCLSYGEGITYWPIREMVLSLAGVTDADSVETAQAHVAELLAANADGPMLAAIVSTAIGLGQAEAPQSEVFWAMRRLFEELARGQPTLILIEDLEWAEDTLLDLIEYVVDLASDAPSLIVATTRPELLERRPGWGSNRDNADVIRLEPLVSTSALELVHAQPGGSAIPAELAERICATADGNPLFVQEIVGGLRDSQALRLVDGAWAFNGSAEVVEIPATIRALLGARIERLPQEERDVLERAAVLGGSFEADALLELLPDVDRAALGTSLRSLVRRELIQPDRAQISGGDAFRFKHLLVRDAAYASLPKSERAELHTACAAWLRRASGARLDEYAEIIGYHLAAAYDYRAALDADAAGLGELALEAAGYLRTAGQRATARGDLHAAGKLLARSIALTPAGNPARPEMLVALANVRRSMGEFKSARETLASVLSSAGRSEAIELRARIEVLLIGLQTAQLDSQGAALQIKDLRARTEATQDDHVIALLDMAEGAVAELEGRNSDAAQAFSSALEKAARGDLGRLRGEALSRLLLNELLGTTPVQLVLGRCEQVLGQPNEPNVTASTLDTYALLLAMADRSQEAIQHEERALSIAADLDDRLAEGLYRGQTLAVVHALSGDLDAAYAEAQLGCDLLLSLEAQAWLSSAACVLGEIELARGNTARAEHWLTVAETSSVATDFDARTRAAVLKSRLAVISGHADEARTLIGATVKLVDGTELLYLHGIVAAADACVAAATGDTPIAVARLAEAAQIHDRKGDVARSRRATELAAQLTTDPQAWRTVALV